MLVYQNPHENLEIWNIDKSSKWRSWKLIQTKILKVKDLKIWDSTRICDSDRVSGATDKGMTTKAHDVGISEVCSGKGP
jgi:hypothetical protein